MAENTVQILVIEDEAVLALYVSDLLEAQGYAVVGVADNGPEALTLYQQHRVDLILCDINLKGEWDGIKTVEKMLALKSVPLIYITAQTDKETVERAKRTFPAAYLAKPIRPDNLQIAVDLAIHNFIMRQLPTVATGESKPAGPEKEAAGREPILRIDNQVFIKHNYQFVRVFLEDILLLEADNTYTTVLTASHKYALRLALGATLNRLDFRSLVRVHRSYVVNIKKITGFNEREIYINARTIPLSAQYKEDFMRRFQHR